MDTSDDPKDTDKKPETPSSETSELIKTLTIAIKEMTNQTKAQSPGKQSNVHMHTPATVPSTVQDLFNVNASLPDVRQRCNTKTQEPEVSELIMLLHGISDLVSFVPLMTSSAQMIVL